MWDPCSLASGLTGWTSDTAFCSRPYSEPAELSPADKKIRIIHPGREYDTSRISGGLVGGVHKKTDTANHLLYMESPQRLMSAMSFHSLGPGSLTMGDRRKK